MKIEKRNRLFRVFDGEDLLYSDEFEENKIIDLNNGVLNIVMDCLNINDINGIPVYEFDIVKNKYGGYLIVVWSKKHLAWIMASDTQENTDREWFYFTNEFEYGEYEIVGNIFENPELEKFVLLGEEEILF